MGVERVRVDVGEVERVSTPTRQNVHVFLQHFQRVTVHLPPSTRDVVTFPPVSWALVRSNVPNSTFMALPPVVRPLFPPLLLPVPFPLRPMASGAEHLSLCFGIQDACRRHHLSGSLKPFVSATKTLRRLVPDDPGRPQVRAFSDSFAELICMAQTAPSVSAITPGTCATT